MTEGVLLKDEAFIHTVLTLLDKAKTSVYITTFKAEMKDTVGGRGLKILFEKCAEKATQGIDVRFIINTTGRKGIQPRENIPTINWLKNKNIKVRELCNNRCCHAKIVIIDDSWGILGSHNLSIKSCFYNFEVSFLTCDKSILFHLTRLFERIWNCAQNL